ncbi:MAG: hypothetical protein SFZ24_11800 [Planctomycetota bacterium]|nr:hypothetical protein [Planctomycetota bacterium]
MAKRSSLDTLSIADLQRELRRRERTAGRAVQKLERKRARLVDQLSEIDAQIAQLGGGRRGRSADGGGRLRPRNDSNLVEALAKVLASATMSVTEVAEAVQRAGYQTTSPNFRTIVNQALIKDKRFKRVGRGKYTVKS